MLEMFAYFVTAMPWFPPEGHCSSFRFLEAIAIEDKVHQLVGLKKLICPGSCFWTGVHPLQYQSSKPPPLETPAFTHGEERGIPCLGQGMGPRARNYSHPCDE
jgi:hypothetical protein